MPIETRRVERGHNFYPSSEQARSIPRLYETEHISLADKMLHLHYFTSGSDWWIAEYDPEDGRAFGYACLNGEALYAEWGTIDLTELEAVRVGPVIVERDLHWTATPARVAQLPGWLPPPYPRHCWVKVDPHRGFACTWQCSRCNVYTQSGRAYEQRNGPVCQGAPDTVGGPLRTCRFCGQGVTLDGDGDWIDSTGDAYCETRCAGCAACDDGESHPHTPSVRTVDEPEPST